MIPRAVPAFVNRLMAGAGPVPPKPLVQPKVLTSPRIVEPPEYHPKARCVCGCLAVEHDTGGWCRSGEPCGCSYVELAPMAAAS